MNYSEQLIQFTFQKDSVGWHRLYEQMRQELSTDELVFEINNATYSLKSIDASEEDEWFHERIKRHALGMPINHTPPAPRGTPWRR